MSDSTRDVAVLGVGMHPFGKWGRNFVEYGIVAARAALDDAGIGLRDVQFLAGADTMRNGYPGYVAGSTFAQALGWTGVPVSSAYGACASGAMHDTDGSLMSFPTGASGVRRQVFVTSFIGHCFHRRQHADRHRSPWAA